MSKKGNSVDCTCDGCQRACENKPGWFKPGEAEKAADFLGLPLQAFFKDYLAVDWWEGEKDIFLLAPATDRSGTGTEYPANPKGECIFYKDGLCSIHPVKPFECKEYIHNKPIGDRHQVVAKTWEPNQKQIKSLLGREPHAAGYSISKSFTW